MNILLLRRAERLGAVCINHADVELIEEDGKVTGVIVGEKEIKGKVILSATEINRLGKRTRFKSTFKLVKILNIVLRNRIGLTNAVKFQDITAIPWDDLILVKMASRSKNLRREVKRALDELNRILTVELGEEDTLSTFTYLQPLIDRDYIVLEEKEVITFGFEPSAYRLAAKSVVDRVSDKECFTHVIPLKDAPISKKGIRRYLEEKYCLADIKIMEKMIAEKPGLGSRIVENSPCIWAEVKFAVKYEFAKTLTDVMVGRLGLFFIGEHHAAEDVANYMKKLLGWSEDRVERELKDYEALCRQFSQAIC